MGNQNVWIDVLVVAGFVVVLYILYLEIQIAFLRRRIIVVNPPPVEESGIGCLGTLLLVIVLAAIALFLLGGRPP